MITPEKHLRESIEGNLQDQLRGVGQEAGVRQAL
jgi:hypothetical protein